MYAHDALETVLPIAELAASRNLTIRAVEGTPVYELTKITNDLLNAFNNKVKVFAGGEMIDGSKPRQTAIGHATDLFLAMDTDEASSHDVAFDAYVQQLSKFVASHIGFARNVVKPVIMEMTDTVISEIKEPVNASSEFNIILKGLPEPMFNSTFENSLKDYANIAFIEPEYTVDLKDLSPQELLALMQTGSKAFDESVALWFNQKGDSFFINVWDNLFKKTGYGDRRVRSFNFSGIAISNGDVVYGDTELNYQPADYALAVYLLSRKLVDEVLDGTSMNLSEYRKIMSQYRDAAGSALFNCYSNWNSLLETNILIANTSSDKKTIVVFEPVYTKFLENGGSTDIVLGYLISKDCGKNYGLGSIMEKADEYKQYWSDYVAYKNTTILSDTLTRFKILFKDVFYASLKNMGELEAEVIQAYPNHIQTVTSLFEEKIEKLDTSCLDELQKVIAMIVCESRFYHTDSAQILFNINEAMTVNPGMDPLEAANLAAAKYVFKYIANQLTVSQ